MKNNVTVYDVQKKRIETQDKIYKLLTEFTKETGLEIKDMDFRINSSYVDSMRYLVKLKVEI